MNYFGFLLIENLQGLMYSVINGKSSKMSDE